MLSVATSQTQFFDVSISGVDDEDFTTFESLKIALRNLKGKAKSNFKAREMFPLVRDLWFYSENHNTGDVQLQFRGKGMLSRRHWPAEMSCVTIQTYKQLRQSLGVDIHEVCVQIDVCACDFNAMCMECACVHVMCMCVSNFNLCVRDVRACVMCADHLPTRMGNMPGYRS